MHETVTKIRKLLREGEPLENFAELFSQRLQEGGLSRALSDPLADHVQIFYNEAFRWARTADRLASGAEGEALASLLAQLHFSSRHIHRILNEVLPFLERAEDNLSEREEITHRESGYEREVAPFSRLDSTQAFRDFLTGRPEFTGHMVSEGAQAESDLLKMVYVGVRAEQGITKPADLYALVVEMVLDGRRHLMPSFAEESEFMAALDKATDS